MIQKGVLKMPDVDGIEEDGLNALDNMPKLSPQYVKELEENFPEVDLDELTYKVLQPWELTLGDTVFLKHLLQTLKECRK
jgi:hypothetical protein